MPLFQREGRTRGLTETGEKVLAYADRIFSLGSELLDSLRDESPHSGIPFAAGIADSVPKLIAYQLVEPALRRPEGYRLICREGSLEKLLADLALHRLDLVIADRPMPASLKVRGYSHRLGSSGLSICATPALAATLADGFPAALDGAPFLPPGVESAIRAGLDRWFERHEVRPRVVGEFDDGALLMAFGRAGAGLFPVATAMADAVCAQYGVQVVGTIDEVQETLYAISTERRNTHPAVVAIQDGARQHVF